jgi:hypothetical protein
MSTQESGGVLPGFSDLRSAQARAVRRDAGDNLQPGAFTDPSGIVRPNPGDAFYPHTIEPVDLYGPELLFDGTLVNQTVLANFGVLPSIDVRGAKTLRLDFFWTVSINAQVAFTVEHQVQGSNNVLETARWALLGVVDSTLTAPGSQDGTAFRLSYGAEFRTPAFTAGGTPSLSLDYDVFTKDTVRVRMADIVNADTTMVAAYALAR